LAERHIVGLDAWRAGLLTGGLFFHGTMLHGEHLAFDLIEMASTAFRMAAFFAIAGFLAERSLRNRQPVDWIASRSLRIGIPAIFGVAVISPLIWVMLAFNLPADRLAVELPFQWHHLWFLYALLLYQVVAYLLAERVAPRRIARVIAVVRNLGQASVVVALSVLSLTVMILISWLVLRFAPPLYQRMFMDVRLILGYLPLYLFGMALAASPALRGRMLSDVRLPAIVLALAACAYLVWRFAYAPYSDDVERAEIQIRFVVAALCPPAAVILVIRSALRIRTASPLTRRLCDASFTIYVVHFPLLFATNLLAARYQWPVLIEYAAAILVVGTVSYIFHVAVVRRSPPLALLLNGQLPAAWSSRKPSGTQPLEL
jgi:fucose 4-O-acetylase-like acetyltransferase